MTSLIQSKANELSTIYSDFPKQLQMLVDTISEKDKKIEELMTSNKESNKMKNYNEELKKLQITKDLEINKLNEQLQSKEKEIERLKKTIDDKVPIDYKEKEKELNAQFDIERNKYEQKINDLELKIYKVNDDKKGYEKTIEIHKKRIAELEEEIEKTKQPVEPQKEEEKPKEEEEKPIDTANDNVSQSSNNKQDHSAGCVSKEEYEKLKEEYATLDKQYQEHKLLLTEQLSNKDEQMKQSHQYELNELKTKYENEIQKKERAFKKVNDLNSRTINEHLLKIKELEDKIKTLTNDLSISNKAKTDLEDIILKQEGKVNQLGGKVNKIEQMLKKKNAELQQNETYALQLMNIIQEQKGQIAVMKKKKKEEDTAELNNLQNEINALKNVIESNFNFFI